MKFLWCERWKDEGKRARQTGNNPQSSQCSRCGYARTHICGSAHACRSKPIIQSERAHKFSSLGAAACPVKVRALFLSELRCLTDPHFLSPHLWNSSLPAGLLTPFASPPHCSTRYNVRSQTRRSAMSLPNNIQRGKYSTVFYILICLECFFLWQFLLRVVLPHNVFGTLSSIQQIKRICLIYLVVWKKQSGFFSNKNREEQFLRITFWFVRLNTSETKLTKCVFYFDLPVHHFPLCPLFSKFCPFTASFGWLLAPEEGRL